MPAIPIRKGQIQPRWDRLNKAQKQSSSASPKQAHLGARDSWLHLVAVRWSPQKVISRIRQGFTEALAGEGRRNREQPSALHWTGFREKKTCPLITNQISPKIVRNLHHWRPRLLAWHRPFEWTLPPCLRDAQTPVSSEKCNNKPKKQGASNLLLFLPVNLALQIFAWGRRKKKKEDLVGCRLKTSNQIHTCIWRQINRFDAASCWSLQLSIEDEANRLSH